MWPKLASTNNDPKVVARYYLEAVETVTGCPMYIRSDYGTENSTLAALHIGFHCLNHSGVGTKCFIYGSSKHNVRIEGWWSQLRRFHTSWWINELKDLKYRGLYDGSRLHKYFLAYSMGALLEKELEEFVCGWNSHLIRSNSKARCPSGIPNDLFEMPENYDAVDYLQPIDYELWIHGMCRETVLPNPLYSPEFGREADDLLLNHFNIDRSRINIFKQVFCCLTDNIIL